MRRPDFYDDKPTGDSLSDQDRRLLAELEAMAVEREAIVAEMVALAELCKRIIQPPVRYVL